MEVKQFQAESKRLLDLMINSIYTHKEIFLRELISNASDAIDKLYFRSLTDQSVELSRGDFKIMLTVNKDARTITIEDNGIGMTRDEMENNLGTIARSGSFAFKNENEKKDDVNIIGQFGVGFYSAFMVAKEVTVMSRAFGSDEAWKWNSTGPDGYTMEPCQKDSAGTVIILSIKEDTEEEKYDEYLDKFRIADLVRKYSDYIRYPIMMEMEHSQKKPDSDEYETVTSLDTLNTMVPLWRKNKNEIKPEEYNEFYKSKFMDFEDPLLTIHTKTEGSATYDALLFIPARTPYDYYSKDYQKGLQLYSSGVMIMEKCADLLPDYYGFVRGLVDSEDLSLNISREMLQHDRQLQLIARSLEKKIHSELQKLQKNDREKYEKFWNCFGRQIKFGVYEGFGANKDQLKDLLMFTSSAEEKLVTIPEYIGRMKEDQKEIYYVCGENVARVKALPQTQSVLDKGYEILYLTQDVDEFCLKVLGEYDEKKFKNISDGDLDLQTEEEKEALKKQSEENKDLLEAVKNALGGKVSEVRLSNRVKNAPVCITSGGAFSLEMEKVLNSMPNSQEAGGMKAERILELNPDHPLFPILSAAKDNSERLSELSEVLYDQALLVEGMPIDNPAEYASKVWKLLANQ